MRILVISDTHGDICQAMDIVNNNSSVDMVIHLGDFNTDAARLSSKFPGIHFEFVHGNSDFTIGNVCSEKLLDCEGKKVFITHGHRYGVKSGYNAIYERAEKVKADLVLFGHTHMPYMEYRNGKIFLNPGSASYPRSGGRKTYALIDINSERILPELYNI